MANAALLLRVSAGPDRARALVCLPQAGAGVSGFASWGRALASCACVWAACLPGRESRLLELPLASIEDMADALLGSVLGISAEDVILFGHCGGALIAYELAHRLSASGRPAACLIVSAQVAPRREVETTSRSVATMTLPELVDHLRDLGGTAPELLESQQLMRLVAAGIRADLLAVERYRHPAARPRLSVPIIAMAGREDAISAGNLHEWKNYTTSSIATHLFDAGHFYLTDCEDEVIGFLSGLLAASPLSSFFGR